MGREYMLGTPILMFAASYSTAFRVQTGLTQHNGNLSGFTHQVAVRVLSLSSSVGTRRSNNGYLGRGYDHAGKYYGPRSTAVMMVSEREEELKAKIAKLRGATAKGEGYERVVGSGADLTEKMEKSQTENQSDWERQQQEKLRDGVVVKGNKEAAVSELEEGRRTIVRDPDDPAFEANILDSLMVSREDEIAAEIQTAYLPTSSTSTAVPRVPGQQQQQSFDGAFGTTMGDAEAFFNKPSPFRKAAEEVEARAALAAAEEAIAAAAAADSAGATVADFGAVGGGDVAPEASGAGAAGEAGEGGAAAVKDNAASGEAEAPAPFEKLTGSVGGRWERPPEGVEADTHKPVVSTWGVFERPKDISKAYGGGRDPTLRKVDAEEKKRRDEETQAILRSYRGTTDEDLERERNSEGKIKIALAQAKRAMKFGDSYGAVSALEAVKQECSTHGPLGAVVFLELAMALEVTGRSYEAQSVYKVLRRSKNREVRAQAKRLLEGLEAMTFLKYAQPGEVQTESEVSKMWSSNYQQMSKESDRCYDATFFEKDADGRPKGANVFAVTDAKEVLMLAYKYGGGISSKRVLNAFKFLEQRSEEADVAARRETAALVSEEQEQQEEDNSPSPRSTTQVSEGERARRRLPWQDEEEALLQGGAGLVALVGDVTSLESRVTGEWNLVIKADSSKVDVLGREGSLTLAAGGALKAVEPAGPMSIAKEGDWELDLQQRTIKLTYKSSKLVGFVNVGGGQEKLDLLAVDDDVIVASEAGGSASRSKYRLLVRKKMGQKM